MAIAGESLNIDDISGSMVNSLVWDQGASTKVRGVGERVLVELAHLPGPPWLLTL